MKIAAWSGPRNLSTALMYSFAARGDCAVWDEPYYAAYLEAAEVVHPLRHAILTAHDSDPTQIAHRCAGPMPEHKPHWYMKHMAHHILPDFDLNWAETCVNIHLIRHPARVIASYGAKRTKITLHDIGYAQQSLLFQRFPGPVIDTTQLRQDPKAMLQKLCAAIGLPWCDATLGWPAGPKAYDGAWAAHWYGAVHRSTGFAGAEGPLPVVPDEHAQLMAEAMAHYNLLKSQAMC